MTDQTQAPRIAPLEPPYAPAVEEMLRKWMPPGTGARAVAAVPDARRARVAGRADAAARRRHPRPRAARAPRPRADDPPHLRALRRRVRMGRARHLLRRRGGVQRRRSSPRPSPRRRDDPVWSERERAVIALADELHDTAQVSDATYAERRAPLHRRADPRAGRDRRLVPHDLVRARRRAECHSSHGRPDFRDDRAPATIRGAPMSTSPQDFNAQIIEEFRANDGRGRRHVRRHDAAAAAPRRREDGQGPDQPARVSTVTATATSSSPPRRAPRRTPTGTTTSRRTRT